MEDAEKAAKKGFEISKQDVWAQHAVSCHYDFHLLRNLRLTFL